MANYKFVVVVELEDSAVDPDDGIDYAYKNAEEVQKELQYCILEHMTPMNLKIEPTE